jgi:hypothetical protein
LKVKRAYRKIRVSAYYYKDEKPAYTPDHADDGDRIQRRRLDARQTGPNGEMHVVQRGENAPKPVHLRIVSVDLGGDEENSSKDSTESNRGDQGVGGEVDSFQIIHIPASFAQAFGKPSQLFQVGENCESKGSVVRKGLHPGKW